MADLGFSLGNRVAWSHDNGLFAASTVLRGPYGAPPPGCDAVPLGELTAIANESGSLLEVTFADGSVRVLTADELVKVEES